MNIQNIKTSKIMINLFYNITNKLLGFFEKAIRHINFIKYVIYFFIKKNPKVIIPIDGGICSQMYQYFLGSIFKSKGNDVYYDLEFYEIDGYDNNKKFVRNFDLLKAFPYLDFKEASVKDKFLYKSSCLHYEDYNNVINKTAWTTLKAPLYLAGYYHKTTDFSDIFRQIFKINYNVLDYLNTSYLADIKSRKNTVSIHIRLGDLKTENLSYGETVPISYFYNSILFIKKKIDTPFFYIFSDEPEEVKKIIPKINLKENEFFIFEKNGSDKGYFDLILISYCNFHICSKGTLGKYGALLSDSPDKFVIMYDDAIERAKWEKSFIHPFFIK